MQAEAADSESAPKLRRRRRLAGRALLLVVLLAVAAYAAPRLLTGESGIARAIAWGESDIADQGRFPARRVAASGAPSALLTATPPAALTASVNGMPLERFLAEHDTRAFLVVQHGRVLYERYFDGASRTSRETSFSMAKSIVSTLVGIAIDRGEIGSVDDPITDYLPELADRDAGFARISLRHLLAMASGIGYAERGLPWSDDAITYYGTDLRSVALERTKIEGPPERRWLYNNFHPLLLGLVLERATQQRIADYASRVLWQPLATEADATWSLDSSEHGFEKLESGFNARARDFARFGMLMLHQGQGPRERIVSRNWVRRATHSNGIAGHYGWFWWVDPGGAFHAAGKYGQVIAVFPDRDAVIVRLGSDEAGVQWSRFALEIADRLPPG